MNQIEIIALTIGFVTLLITMIGVILAILQVGNNVRVENKENFRKIDKRFEKLESDMRQMETNLRSEMKQVETNLRNEFKSDLNTLEVKLNTLLMGLFRNYNPENYNKNQENK